MNRTKLSKIRRAYLWRSFLSTIAHIDINIVITIFSINDNVVITIFSINDNVVTIRIDDNLMTIGIDDNVMIIGHHNLRRSTFPIIVIIIIIVIVIITPLFFLNIKIIKTFNLNTLQRP